MAKASLPIPPFPADIDRRDFANYLSGFTDGEGYFGLAFVRQTKGASRPTPAARFAFIMRADDSPILEQIQSFLGCGRTCLRRSYTTNPNPSFVYAITRIPELFRIVVPHFERYPLRAKKSRDFVIWKEGVSLAHQVFCRGRRRSGRHGKQTWTGAEIAQFTVLHDALKVQREFNANAFPPPITRPLPDDDCPLFRGTQ